MSQSVPLISPNYPDVEKGGCDYDYPNGIEDDFAYRNNVLQAPKHIRLGFIRKVYGLLAMQILMTLSVVAFFLFTPHMNEFVKTNDWITLPVLLGSIITLIVLFIKRNKYPANLILLAAFTIFEAIAVGIITTYFSQAVVLEALALTFIVITGLTLFTFQTKYDFSAMYSGLFCGLMILMMGGFLSIFISESSSFQLVLAIGGAILFSLFVIFDTQMMMHHLSPEEYIVATIQLYLDFINLFLYILRALQYSSSQ